MSEIARKTLVYGKRQVPTEPATEVPRWVHRSDWCAAMEPLAKLLGLSMGEILQAGFTVTAESIQLAAVVPVADVVPIPSDLLDPFSWSAEQSIAPIWVWPLEVQILNVERDA